MAAKSTHELLVDTQIKVGPGVVCAITVITDGTNDAQIILYDVASSSDVGPTNKITEIQVNGTNHYGGRTWVEPVMFQAGLYADITNSGAGAGSYIVEWRN